MNIYCVCVYLCVCGDSSARELCAHIAAPVAAKLHIASSLRYLNLELLLQAIKF